jgi:hypothetical protein
MNALGLRSWCLHLLVIPALCGALIFSGCNILNEGDPQTAHVVIGGADGHPILLVTTTDFDVVSSEGGEARELYVFSADTTAVASPFERQYSMGTRTRFYLVASSDSISAAPVTVKVFLDGELRYSRSTHFGADRLEFLFVARSD